MNSCKINFTPQTQPTSLESETQKHQRPNFSLFPAEETTSFIQRSRITMAAERGEFKPVPEKQAQSLPG